MNTNAPNDRTLPKDASEIAQAMHARERIVHVFDVANIFGVAGKPVHQIAMQVLPAGEEREARDAAWKTHDALARRAGPAADDAKKDADSLHMERNLEALFRICLRVDAKGQPTRGAAFPGVQWIRDHLSVDEIATLIALYDELRIKHGRTALEIDDAKVEAIASMLGEHVNDEIPEQYLAPFPRWYLTHFAVLVCSKLAEARKSVELLLMERDANAKEREALEAELAALRREISPAPAPPVGPSPGA